MAIRGELVTQGAEIRCKSYKYFGSGLIEAENVVIKKFGQSYPLPDSVALDILRGGGGILLAEDFDAVGFSRVHISDRRERTPKNPAYMEKHAEALRRMRALRDQMEQQQRGLTPEGEASNV